MTSVFIVPSAEEAPPARVYVCTHVDPALAERSTVLQALTSIDGPACLPDSISRQEISVWAKLGTHAVSESVPTVDVCTALRVADALGDSKTREIAVALGGRLLRTDWSDPDDGDAMMYTIHSLNSNIQHEVFSAIASDVQTLMTKADDWPISMQQAGVDAVLASETTLHLAKRGAQHGVRLSRLLLLLSRSRLSSPGLSTLKSTCTLPTRAAACHLADTIAHHTTLTSLSLDDMDIFLPSSRNNIIPISHAALATALSSIPQLSGLTHLSMSICRQLDPHSPDTAPLVAALSRAVSGPRHLSTLALRFGDLLHTSSPRPCTSPLVCVRATLDPLISAISTAPALASLSITADTHLLPSRPFAQPFRCLRSLQLSPSTVSLIAPSCITGVGPAESPAEALTALTSITLMYDRAPDPSVGVLKAFLAAVAPCRALQSLEITTISVSPRGSGAAHTAFAPLRHLSALTSLNIDIRFDATKPRALPQIAAAIGQIPSLIHLSFGLHVNGPPQHDAPADSAATDDALGNTQALYPESLDVAFDPLLALVHLRSLQFTVSASDEDGDVHERVLKRLNGALMDLIAHRPTEWGGHLTQLHLGVHTHRPLRRIVRTMAPMHALRNVVLGAVTVRAGDLAVLATRMPALTRLVLYPEPLDRAFLRRYAAFAATMPALVKSEMLEFSGPNWELASNEVMPGRWRLRRLFSYITELPELPRRGTYRLPDRLCVAGCLPARHRRTVREMADDALLVLRANSATVNDSVTSITYDETR